MAAQEQQGERVVPVRVGHGVGGVAEQFGLRGGQGEAVLAAPARAVAADVVDQLAGGDGDQPAPGVVRDAGPGPLQGGRQQSFLDRVLARVEGAVAAYEHAEDLRRQLAQQVLGGVVRGGHTSAADSCSTGHSSTGSTSANGMSAAISRARSGLSQSSR